MRFIDICDDFMQVLDENGLGYDGHILTSHAEARRQIETWATEYAIDLQEANRQVDEYFAR